MKYCASTACKQDRYFSEDEDFCSVCREELTPCIRCLCGQQEFSPKNRHEDKACRKCGERLTPDYLGQCMSRQLKGMVEEIKGKQASAAIAIAPFYVN